MSSFARFWGLSFTLLFIAACGGGGGGDGGDGTSNPHPPPSSTMAPTSLKMSSDLGDFVGDGRNYSYSQANADFTVVAQGGLLVVDVLGDARWRGEFQMPRGYSKLATGTYNNLTRYPLHDPVIGGMNWIGDSRACAGVAGAATINKVVYEADQLVELDMQFTQYCDGQSFALRGELHWNAKDTTRPPGPAAPPAGLWQPATGITPATGTYVYLESQPDDYIGAGSTYLYTNADSIIVATVGTGSVQVHVTGDEFWNGVFQGMSTLGLLEPGYYGNLKEYPFHNPAAGGLNWSGEHRSCGRAVGWFVVDSVTYSDASLVAAEIRFEQRCVYSTGVLRGKIRWDGTDMPPTRGPVAPPPDLWQPAPGATPATGNYVYFEVPEGNFVDSGKTFLYTQADSMLSVRTRTAHVGIDVTGDKYWIGDFVGMAGIDRLEVGYYGNLLRYPVHNPTVGGVSWRGADLLCGGGWFVVDAAVYEGGTLKSIELRFEQGCGLPTARLRGKIRWSADDTTVATGPTAPPAGLWQPANGATPASGNYAYFESLIGASFGEPQKYLYTAENSQIFVDSEAALLMVRIHEDPSWWGDLQGMNSLDRFEVGYYGDLQSFPLHNPAKGGLRWVSSATAGCNTLSGWFVIDAVTYDGATLASIEARFEQRCTGSTSVLHGKLRWSR